MTRRSPDGCTRRPSRLDDSAAGCHRRRRGVSLQCFGDKYKQWNAAFDAGYCAALGKPYITLHDTDIVHALKEVDAAAQAWCQTTDQVVETLRYVLME